jgi:hypothetical protein
MKSSQLFLGHSVRKRLVAVMTASRRGHDKPPLGRRDV